MTRTSRLFAEWALLFVAAIVLIVVAQRYDWTERLDQQILDFSMQSMAAEPHSSIVIVEIDEKSLAKLGSWPWTRDIHARLVENLSASQPGAIGMDILYIEPSEQAADEQLGDAVASAGNTVLAHSFAELPQQPGALLPVETIKRGAAALGHVGVKLDSDGIVRSFELTTTEGGEEYPHFIKSLLDIARPEAATDLPDNAIVPYLQQGTFPTQPAADVIANQHFAEFFEGKTVLVGATAQGLGDQYAIPGYAGGLMSGVEMQANLLSAIKNDQLVAPASSFWTLSVQLLAIAILFIVFWRSSPRSSLVIAASLIAALLVLTIIGVRFGNLWLATGPAMLAIILAYPLWAWRRLATVSHFLEAEAKTLRSATDDPIRREGVGFDVVARQVSRVKMLSGEVRRNLQLVQDVINATPDAMLVCDAAGSVSMANHAAKNLFGENCVVGGRSFAELLAGVNALYEEVRQEVEFPGQRHYLLARAPIDPAVGSEVLVMRDITAMKADERQRRETLEFLSHDMRSPQVAIIGLTGNSGDTLEKEERLSRIESQARRTLKLTDDFVQIARISTEGVILEEVEINSVLFETADRAFPLAHRKNITIVTNESEEPMFVKLDPAAIARSLDNLVGNAIKFSDEGSEVVLSVDVSDENEIVIAVRDSGPGLPPERVENPFARFGAKSNGAGPSAGLGLAYVKQVVDKHGGNISIVTAPGEGTEFRIAIPYS